MNQGRVRIYELSKELNLDNRDILSICERLNILVKSHSSVITEEQASRIRASASAIVSQDKVFARPVPKQQVLSVRRPSASSVSSASLSERGFAIRRTPRTGRGYIEPLLNVSSALPLHMVFIPGGTFLMGSPNDEPERDVREGPQHDVTLPQFFLGRYPVTQSQWRFVTGLPQVGRELQLNPSQFEGDNRPVEEVSWYEALEFCDRLSRHTGRIYRLPTEAEWEYACRAGTTTAFHFGKTITSELANYRGIEIYNKTSQGEYRQETTPVEHFESANAWGLSDMHGNVWEWCQDHWHDNYEGAPINGSAWLSEGEDTGRVIRGGSWYNAPRNCRSACCSLSNPRVSNSYIGFRVICSAPRTLM